jgi:hypothetical protein
MVRKLLHQKQNAATNNFEMHNNSDIQYQAVLEGCNDARTGIPPGIPGGAMCVQRFDDSLNSAIHITYRISLRSSSMPEPRDPLLKVLTIYIIVLRQHKYKSVGVLWRARAS